MKRAGTLASLTLFLLSAACEAQYPLGAAALRWSGSSGNSAGPFCWESSFSCVPYLVPATAGETVTITLRGEYLGAWAIGASFSASQCQTFPGIQNALALDQPLLFVITGTLTQPGPILACPPGTSTFAFIFPAALPPGTTFAIQALIYGAGNVPTFSRAIQVAVV